MGKVPIAAINLPSNILHITGEVLHESRYHLFPCSVVLDKLAYAFGKTSEVILIYVNDCDLTVLRSAAFANPRTFVISDIFTKQRLRVDQHIDVMGVWSVKDCALCAEEIYNLYG
jgi:hypothetical protein